MAEDELACSCTKKDLSRVVKSLMNRLTFQSFQVICSCLIALLPSNGCPRTLSTILQLVLRAGVDGNITDLEVVADVVKILMFRHIAPASDVRGRFLFHTTLTFVLLGELADFPQNWDEEPQGLNRLGATSFHYIFANNEQPQSLQTALYRAANLQHASVRPPAHTLSEIPAIRVNRRMFSMVSALSPDLLAHSTSSSPPDGILAPRNETLLGQLYTSTPNTARRTFATLGFSNNEINAITAYERSVIHHRSTTVFQQGGSVIHHESQTVLTPGNPTTRSDDGAGAGEKGGAAATSAPPRRKAFICLMEALWGDEQPEELAAVRRKRRKQFKSVLKMIAFLFVRSCLSLANLTSLFSVILETERMDDEQLDAILVSMSIMGAELEATETGRNWIAGLIAAIAQKDPQYRADSASIGSLILPPFNVYTASPRTSLGIQLLQPLPRVIRATHTSTNPTQRPTSQRPTPSVELSGASNSATLPVRSPRRPTRERLQGEDRLGRVTQRQASRKYATLDKEHRLRRTHSDLSYDAFPECSVIDDHYGAADPGVIQSLSPMRREPAWGGDGRGGTGGFRSETENVVGKIVSAHLTCTVDRQPWDLDRSAETSFSVGKLIQFLDSVLVYAEGQEPHGSDTDGQDKPLIWPSNSGSKSIEKMAKLEQPGLHTRGGDHQHKPRGQSNNPKIHHRSTTLLKQTSHRGSTSHGKPMNTEAMTGTPATGINLLVTGVGSKTFESKHHVSRGVSNGMLGGRHHRHEDAKRGSPSATTGSSNWEDVEEGGERIRVTRANQAAIGLTGARTGDGGGEAARINFGVGLRGARSDSCTGHSSGSSSGGSSGSSSSSSRKSSIAEQCQQQKFSRKQTCGGEPREEQLSRRPAGRTLLSEKIAYPCAVTPPRVNSSVDEDDADEDLDASASWRSRLKGEAKPSEANKRAPPRETPVSSRGREHSLCFVQCVLDARARNWCVSRGDRQLPQLSSRYFKAARTPHKPYMGSNVTYPIYMLWQETIYRTRHNLSVRGCRDNLRALSRQTCETRIKFADTLEEAWLYSPESPANERNPLRLTHRWRDVVHAIRSMTLDEEDQPPHQPLQRQGTPRHLQCQPSDRNNDPNLVDEPFDDPLDEPLFGGLGG